MSELEKAFLKAKKNFPAIPKNGVNPFFKSPAHPQGAPYMLYEDIDAGTAKPLADEGIYPQHSSRFLDGGYIVGTYLVHAPSGEKSEPFEFPIPVDTPQKTSAGITYAKRVTKATVLGLSAEADDDGNAVDKNPTPKTQPTYTATNEQKRELMKLCLELGLDNVEELRLISDYCLGSKMSDLKAKIGDYSVLASK